MRRPTSALVLSALLVTGCTGPADDDGGPSTVVQERQADNGPEPVSGQEADQDDLGQDE